MDLSSAQPSGNPSNFPSSGRGPDKYPNSIRLFESDFLERFTHVHPIIPLVMWTPLITYLIWRSFAVDHLSFAAVAGLGLAALFVWTFAEYTLHRFVFHLKPTTPARTRLAFIIHGLHHDDPVDASRLVMPPLPGLILAALLYSLFRGLLGPVLVEPFFAFFIVGYLCYDYIHFSVHHFNPKTRAGKYLKASHMRHHFVSHEARWGVSSPLWDYVFGTVHPPKKT